MSIVRSGRQIRVSDPRMGGCGDCPGVPSSGPICLSPTVELPQTQLLTCGFEEGEAIAHLDAGTNAVRSVLFDIVSGVFDAPPPLVTDIVHSGTYSIQMLSGGPGVGGFSDKIRKAFDPALTYPCSFGNTFYVYWVSMDSAAARDLMFSEIGSATQGDRMFIGARNIDATHMKLKVMRGGDTQVAVGTVPLTIGQWYRFELYSTIQTDGSFVTVGNVYLDDATTPLDTATVTGGPGSLNTGNPVSTWTFTPFYAIAPAKSDMRFDDLAIFSRVGPYGPRHIVIAVPSAQVQGQWTPAGGAITNLEAIDDLPSTWVGLDSQFNHVFTDGQVDLFRVPNLIPDGKQLQLIHLCLDGAPGTGNGMKLIVVDGGGTEIQSPNLRNDGTVLPLMGQDGGTIAFKLPPAIQSSCFSGYSVGYRSTLPNNGGNPERKVDRLWANVEYI